MTQGLEFRKLTRHDFPLLVKWHAMPHIRTVWKGERSEKEVRETYTRKLAEKYLEMYIMLHDGRAIGFLQTYKAADVENGWWPDEPETTWGIDLYIGEPDCLDKGLGSALLRQFSNDLLARPGIEKIIADPPPTNPRSVRAFEKAGFKIKGPTVTPDGDAILLEKKINLDMQLKGCI